MRKTGGRLPGSKRPITELNLFCEAVIMSSGPASLASSDETNEYFSTTRYILVYQSGEH